ncbi:MAG: hypothetical protein JXB14_07220 [Candidatus Altiarchaeota archaeon]|nr:hypothetical protein [Candidatus Altiarchaeota archaeon]
MDRVPTGIKGLDEILDGGFMRNSSILLCGAPGSGKTNLGLNFLYKGAAEYGEKGLYLTLELPIEEIVKNAVIVYPKWDWDSTLNKDIFIKKVSREDIGTLPTVIRDSVHDLGVKRIVIDSITMLSLFTKDEADFRDSLFKLLDFIRSLECTALIAAEKPYSDRDRVEFSIEEFVCDGVIILYSIPKGELRYKAMEVLKMRSINHQTKLCPFEIGPDGITVYPVESLFWLDSERKKKSK